MGAQAKHRQAVSMSAVSRPFIFVSPCPRQRHPLPAEAVLSRFGSVVPCSAVGTTKASQQGARRLLLPDITFGDGSRVGTFSSRTSFLPRYSEKSSLQAGVVFTFRHRRVIRSDLGAAVPDLHFTAFAKQTEEAAVARQVGYTNQFAFSDTFQRWIGSRPSAYRKTRS